MQRLKRLSLHRIPFVHHARNAAMCAGVVPQQPPTIVTPASKSGHSLSAMYSGERGYSQPAAVPLACRHWGGRRAAGRSSRDRRGRFRPDRPCRCRRRSVAPIAVAFPILPLMQHPIACRRSSGQPSACLNANDTSNGKFGPPSP